MEILIQVCLILVLVGVASERQYGLYTSALIATIGQVAFIFLRLVGSTFSGIVYKSESSQSV
jgi:hypothetical protein